MGVFYYVHSVALIEDLPIAEDEFENMKEFYSAATNSYSQVIATFFFKL